MFVWLKRGLLGLLLLVVLLTGGVYFLSAKLLEVALGEALEGREATYQLKPVRWRLSGLELELVSYEEPGLLLESLAIYCPWSQLWSVQRGFQGELHCKSIRWTPSEMTRGSSEDISLPWEEQVAALASLLDSTPLQALDLSVDRLVLESPVGLVHLGADFTFLKAEDGQTHLSTSVRSDAVEAQVRMKVLPGGQGLALDFVATARDWEVVKSRYLTPYLASLAAQNGDLYVNPLGTGRGFLDVSGYARWNAAEPNALSVTALADLGAGELYLPGGELLLRNASVGLARDGMGRLRAYAKGGIESSRFGAWMGATGDWAVRVEDTRVAVELRTEDGLALSLGHADWGDLLKGQGDLSFYLEATALNADLVRALAGNGIPYDLEWAMGLSLEGQAGLEAWQPESLSVHARGAFSELSWPEKGAHARDLSVELVGAKQGAAWDLDLMDVQLGSGDVLGFAFADLSVQASGPSDGPLVVAPVTARLMGGQLWLDAMEVDPAHLEGLPFRARLEGLDLTELAAAVPQFKGELTGRLSGQVEGVWRGGQPVLTDGQLQVDPESGARLRYDVKGLLTRGMVPGSPAYQQYRMAELALQDLALKRFEIDVFPEGNQARPIRLQFLGESDQNGTVVPVDYTLNVNVEDTAGLLEILRMIQQGELDVN